MSIESEILRVLLDPPSYVRYRKAVEPHALSDDGRNVLSTLDSIHEQGTESSTTIRPEDLRLAAVALNPGWKGEDRGRFDSALERLTGPSSTDASLVLKTWVEREVASALADKADRFMESPGKFKKGFFPELKALHDKLQEDIRAFSVDDPTERLEADLEHVLEALNVGGTWTWRLNCLNQSLGPLYLGQLIVLGARPEGGKTTFMCSEMAHLLPQMPEGSIIVFFNNETHGQVVRLRQMQAVVGWKTNVMKSKVSNAQKQYDKLITGDRHVLIKDVHGGSLADVDRTLDRYGDRIKLIVFDQAGKLNGYERKDGNDASRLQRLAAHLKMVAANVAPVLTTWWCSGDAEGEQYIGMDKLDGTKTGVPGEAEVVITFGHTNKPEDEGTRYVNIPKNKSLACPKEEYRHSKWIVKMDSAIARVVD